jgi:hypothetical protein
LTWPRFIERALDQESRLAILNFISQRQSVLKIPDELATFFCRIRQRTISFRWAETRETRGGIRQELAAGAGAARGASRNSLKLAEQTRSCDYDPCDEGGEAGEQQQIMQDDGHGKCPYAAAGARTNIWAGIWRRQNGDNSPSTAPGIEYLGTLPPMLLGRADEVIEWNVARSSCCSPARRWHGHWLHARSRRPSSRPSDT